MYFISNCHFDISFNRDHSEVGRAQSEYNSDDSFQSRWVRLKVM